MLCCNLDCYLGGIISLGCPAMSLCELDMAFYHGSVRMFLLPYLGHISPRRKKIYGLLQLIIVCIVTLLCHLH